AVDEADGAVPGPLTDQGDGLGDGGVGRDPHAQELVGAQTQQVEHRRVDLVERAPSGAVLEDRVVASAQAQRAVDELGGESGVARSEEHTSELQSRENLVCRLLLEK